MRGPSHGTVVAYMALFTALGGSAYAATQIDGKTLVDRSVKAKKLRKNTLTGVEVNESALGKVRSAVVADTSRNIRRIDYRGGETGIAGKTLLSVGPMKLTVTCAMSDDGGAVVTLGQLSSTTGIGNAVATTALPGPQGSDHRTDERTELSGKPFTPSNRTLGFLILVADAGEFEQGEGHAIYRDPARVVSITYHGFAAMIEGKPYCEFNGTATIS
jgi:hypothetical protein